MSEYRIGIALYEDVEELDFAGPYEVLTAWARGSEREITVRTVAETTDAVRCSHGLRVLPDVAWSDVGPLDLFLLPGGDTRELRKDEAFRARVRALAGTGTTMTSVCTGALVFADAGLLDGQRGHREHLLGVVLLDLELAEQKLGCLVIPARTGDCENDDLMARLILRTSKELEEPPVGEHAAELAQDERARDLSLQDLQRGDDRDRLRPSQRVLGDLIGDNHAAHNDVRPRCQVPVGDRDDCRCRGQAADE